MKNERQGITDNIYGGVRYRSSYDDSKRAAAVRVLRLRRRGTVSFRLSVVTVALFCTAVISFAAIYSVTDDTEKTVADTVQLSEDAVAVNASVCTDRTADYPGHFRLSEMNSRARDAYHMPIGVMVSEVYTGDGVIRTGDIIIRAEGVDTPNIAAFSAVFSSADEDGVELSVYRKGKLISLNYVRNED